ncbi:FAD:protein FMN transferase [Lysinimonas soli]|uniref:FAD:protein FMN transferase n=1 Tax=Lysinimonas soli TaxID=1074233 RepID=A0ABW0NKB5_9MICO
MATRTDRDRGLAAADWSLWSTTGRLVVTDAEQLDAARRIVDRETALVEEASSRFRDDSELARIAPQLPTGVVVSDVLASLIRAALMAAQLTEGAVDPSLGRAINALGYDRDIRLVLDDDGPVRAVATERPGWKHVRLDGSRLTVPEGLSLDLGATAKAVAADRAAAAVAQELGIGVLVSLGGDIATAGPAPRGNWQIDVQDLPADPACRISVGAGTAVATSSTQRRTWRRGATTLHHIIDPLTGMSAASLWRSATVAGPSCLVANALSTAAIVWGSSAPQRLAAHRLPARLVSAEGSVIVLGGWPAEEGSTEWEVWR